MANRTGKAGSGRKTNIKAFTRVWTYATCTRVQSALGHLRTPFIKNPFTMGKWDTNHLTNIMSNLKTLTFDERTNLNRTISCIFAVFPPFFANKEAIPGHWAAGIRKHVINKYKNSMDTFLDNMKEKGVADEPKWDAIFADELQAPALAAPMPPPVPMPPFDATAGTRKRARSVFTDESNLSKENGDEVRRLSKKILAQRPKEEALEATIQDCQRGLRKIQKRKDAAAKRIDHIMTSAGEEKQG